MNLGLLKLQLFHYGIRAGEDLPFPLTNPFGLVHLVIPGKIPVSVHLNQNGSESPFRLSRKGESFFLETKEEQIPVQWTPPLKSYEKKISSGLLVSDILTVHGDFIAVHPSHPCRFGQSGLSCRYCGSSKELSEHPPFTPRDLVKAVQIVLREKRCDQVHLSSGQVATPDGGVEWLTEWVAEIRKHLNVLISLDLAPPETDDWIDQTYAIGVDALYYDSDFFNPMEEPPKDRAHHQKRQWEALKYAAKIFPKGAVLSHLVIGFEPLAETQRRLDQLIDLGVVPVLTYFPPYNRRDLQVHWKATPETIVSLYTQLYEHMLQKRIPTHWVQQYDAVLTPLEGRLLSKKPAGIQLTLQNFYNTGFGRSARLGLASLRRHLRVREVPA